MSEPLPSSGETIYTPLTLENWATHYGVETKELTIAMRRATAEIFAADKEIARNEGDPDLVKRRKRELTDLHRGAPEGAKGGVLFLSPTYQERVRNILHRETPKDPSEYLNLNQLKPKFTKANLEQLRVISQRLRSEHPEWYCRTKYTSGGLPTYGLLRSYEKEFRVAADALIEEMMRKRRRDRYDLVPAASSEVRGLTQWGMNEERIVASEMGMGGWIERYE